MYEEGSIWRRWDLHVHTPGTKKEDSYEGRTIEEKWDKFYSDVATYVGDGTDPLRNIAVIGITDYLSIDNYLKVVSEKRLPDTVKLVLPNVELRMSPIAKNSPVNIHCIFSPDIADELENRFFAKLKFNYEEREFSASRQDLIALGREYENNLELELDRAYISGISQFVISESALRNVFKGDPKLRAKTIIVVSNKSSDGASGVTSHEVYYEGGNSQLDATKRAIFQLSDAIFSSNLNDRKYFLGEGVDDKETVIRNYGSLKACIHGSDAHTNKKLFEPDEQRYCWIKANPTFNGLQQIIYEPEARVRISSLEPEKKKGYQVIRSVLIKNEDFQPNEIIFNDKLTCIIGGKSTGKSTLLHNMAKAIDASQVQKKTELTGAKSKEVSDVIVQWGDGTLSGQDEIDEQHKIVYIPQTYLNRLSDRQEEETEIDKIIHEIITLNTEIAILYTTMNDALREQKTKVDKLIYDFIQKHIELTEHEDKLKELGTKEGIAREIETLKKRKEELSKELDLSEEQIKQYDEALLLVAKMNEEIGKLKTDKDNILQYTHPIVVKPRYFVLTPLSEERLKTAIDNTLEASAKIWENEKEKIIVWIDEEIKKFEGMRQKYQGVVEMLAAKISENEAVAELTTTIAAEEMRMKKYTDIESEHEGIKREYTLMLGELSDVFLQYLKIRGQYEEEVNHRTDTTTDGLEFSVVTNFRLEAFLDFLNNTFDQRKTKNGVVGNLKNDYSKENLELFIKACVSDNLPILKGKSKENVLREVLSDWYNTSYQVKMDNDVIDEMSPGKKALVLLKMLINLAESQCPILIDQPEDDLDNRSIFDELIPFIRKKKIDRQIIVVTHNANVVLGGDAETVIVANQDGKNSPKYKYRFEYRSGAIEDDMILGSNKGILNEHGIQFHICSILEGGKAAFDLRKNKYKNALKERVSIGEE